LPPRNRIPSHPTSRSLAISPIYFAATKLEEFHSRGGGDFVESHDLEDVLAVFAGLPSLRDAVDAGGSGVARDVRDDLARLTAQEAFAEATWGHFEGDAAGQARAASIVAWLRKLPERHPPQPSGRASKARRGNQTHSHPIHTTRVVLGRDASRPVAFLRPTKPQRFVPSTRAGGLSCLFP
jgi:hypothetical protein